MDDLDGTIGQGPPSDAPAARSKRAGGRDSLLLVAQLRLAGETTAREVRVRNLSEGGLMVELDRMVAVGTAVMLDLRGIGEITGTIAWGTEGRLGIALDSPIDPKKARKPVGRAKPVPVNFHAKAGV
jgi:hypothetical protein